MSNMFQKMYAVKKKRVRDPSLPPPPTLLGQVKVIKDVSMGIEQLQHIVQQQGELINQLKFKLNHVNFRLDSLTNYVKNNRK